MKSDRRIVVRSRRFQLVGIVSLLVTGGLVVLAYIVIASPGRSLDHPGGFTSGARILTVAGCVIAALALAAYGVSGLRVALILDETRLVIRNPRSTTIVDWKSRPRFEIRNRQQDVSITSPNAAGAPRPEAHVTYRYREIVCVAHSKRFWIAATSRMRHGDRVDDMLRQLREEGGRLRSLSAAHAESPGVN